MSPMHVVLASHQQLPAKGYGGPQRVVGALTRGLAALGHRVTLLALAGSRGPEAKRSEERRVGEEGRSRWSPYHLKKKKKKSKRRRKHEEERQSAVCG